MCARVFKNAREAASLSGAVQIFFLSDDLLMSASNINALRPGFELDDYVIEKILGQGTFGITYQAFHRSSGLPFAIKEYFPREFCARARDDGVIASGSREDIADFHWGLERFLEEAKTLTLFDHPNVVKALRLFQAQGTAYLVMEYCDGQALDAILERDHTLTEPEIRAFLLPLLDGLEAVHAYGIVHRDIKPGNIFIRHDGQPILLDFGAARQALGNHSRSVTSLATRGYAALEQYATRGRLGPWTDVYGLSATLYRCIHGAKPSDALDRQMEDDLQPAAVAARGDYSAGLLRAIDAGLKLRHEQRLPSISEFRAVLSQQEPSRHPAGSAKTTTSGRAPGGRRPHPPRSTASGVLVLIGLLLVMGAVLWGMISSPAPPPAADLVEIELPTTSEAAPEPDAEADIAQADAAEIAPSEAELEALRQQAAEKERRLEEEKRQQEALQRKQAEDRAREEEKAQQALAEEQKRKQAEEKRRSEPVFVANPFQLPACPANQGVEYHNCWGSMEFGDQSYTGEFQHNAPNGWGTRSFPDGDKYSGEQKDGLRHGQGIYTKLNGTRYEGIWEKDNFKTPAKVTYPAPGSRRETQQTLDMRRLERISKDNPNNMSACPDRNWRHQCWGTAWRTFPENSGINEYSGEWLNNVPSGVGRIVFFSGDKYTGEVRNGKANGLGTYVYLSGDKYVGESADNLAHGRGYLQRSNGELQEGIWERDKLVRSVRVRP